MPLGSIQSMLTEPACLLKRYAAAGFFARSTLGVTPVRKARVEMGRTTVWADPLGFGESWPPAAGTRRYSIASTVPTA